MLKSVQNLNIQYEFTILNHFYTTAVLTSTRDARHTCFRAVAFNIVVDVIGILIEIFLLMEQTLKVLIWFYP